MAEKNKDTEKQPKAASKEAAEPARKPAAKKPAEKKAAAKPAAKKPAAKTSARKPSEKKEPAGRGKGSAPEATSKTADATASKASAKASKESTAKKPAAKKAPAKKTEAKGESKTKAAPKAKAKKEPAERPVVNARARYVRVAPRKARLVADQVRGMPIEDALPLLRFSSRTAAQDIRKLIESAAANAEANHDLVADELLIKDIHVDEGPTLRRYRPRALGRATRINKRTSHIAVALTPED
jgi:large subunit ribosomal protein L22